MKGIVVRMADGARSEPVEPVVDEDSRARPVVSLVSLLLLVVGLLGLVTGLTAVSATGIFLYALFGFGAAALIVLGYEDWRLAAFAAPLGLASVLITGALLATLGIWAIGPTLFWVLAVVTAFVHFAVLVRAQSRSPGLGMFIPRRISIGRLEREAAAAIGHEVKGGHRSLTRLTVVFTVVGATVSFVCALAAQHLDPSWGGLLGAISPFWYVGLALLVVAIIVGQRVGVVIAGIPVIALQLVLTGSSAIVFDAPRYAWSIKQVAVTSYIMAHGAANPTIDIYQAWPGLFSGVAWLCRVSALSRPLAVARWWPPVIDLCTLLVFYQLAKRVLRDPVRAWLAAAVFVTGYAISDADYFSSQSTAYLLAIAIFAVVFRHRGDKSGMSTSSWVLLVTMAIAEAITHQLTPYMATGALVVLVIFGRSRTKWAPVITLAPAVAWALAHYSYVAQNVSLGQLFNIFSNLSTPGATSGGPAPGTLANAVRYFQGGSALLVGMIAVAALIQNRTKLNWILATCAASAGVLTLANSYGNEADFRVVLFALPWLAILASCLRVTSRIGSLTVWPVLVTTLLSMYLMADMGLDFVYAVRPGDLAAVQKFELSAPVGSDLIIIGYPSNDPVNLTSRYDQVNETNYWNVQGFTKASVNNAALSYEQFMSRLIKTISLIPAAVQGTSPGYYVMTGRQPAAYLAAYNYATLAQYSAFSAQIATSPLWEHVLSTPTAQLYRLRTWPKL